MRARFATVVIASALCAIALFAQSERGTTSGTVQDASGALVPGAKVTLTNSQTGVIFALPSNAGGELTVPQFACGNLHREVREGWLPPVQRHRLGILSQTAGEQTNSPWQMQLELKLYF